MAGKIAIGATNLDLSGPSGLNRYTGELVSAMLEVDPDLVVYAADPAFTKGSRRPVRLIPFPAMRRSSFSGNAARLLWNHTALPGRLRADRASVYFSPIPEGMLSPPCAQVVSVHDLVPLHFPSSHPRLRYYYRYLLPRILAASAAIVTVSEATRRDVVHAWGLVDKPIHVIYQGYRSDVFKPAPPEESARVAQQYGLGSYLLAVGDDRPHKNVEGLVRAFAEIRPAGVSLAIVGRVSPEGELARLVAEMGLRDRVRLLGPLPDADLAALYTSALALVFPSHYEGFGIPPLEAMACGCPVVVSRAASLPEVCGEAAVYVDPASVQSIAEGIALVASDPVVRSSLRCRGLERAAGFSYDRAARELLVLLDAERDREALRHGGRRGS